MNVDPSLNSTSDEIADDFNDESIERLFPWRDISPEEYAAHYSHLIGCYSYHLPSHRYRNPLIEKWARRLGEIVTNTELMENCRRDHLDPITYDRVQKEIADMDKYGL